VTGRFVVPPGTGQLSVKFASGGSGAVTGTMVIDDLSVRISKPVITSVVNDLEGRTISWLSMPSKLYTVQFASSLNLPTVWNPLITGQPGDFTLTNSYLDSELHVGNTGFYRVVQE
jgi:hypothetical protein